MEREEKLKNKTVMTRQKTSDTNLDKCLRNLALPFHKSDVGCNLYKVKIIKHFFETKSTHVSVRFTITKICGISFEWSGGKSQGLFLKGQDFKEQTLWDKTERKLVKPLYLLGKITFAINC